MSETLELMRRRIQGAEDIHSVVRVMKALAATNIRQCEKSVESLAEYHRTIEEGFQIALRDRPDGIPAVEVTPGAGCGVIVFGSDQGLCGSFNEQVASFALEQFNELAPGREDLTILAVGARVVNRLEDAGCAIHARFPLPSTVAGIPSAVHDVLLEVEGLRFQRGIERFLLIHHRPVAPAGWLPSQQQLLPLDREWLERLACRSWHSRSLPTFTMEWRALFSALIRQHLFVALHRAFAECLASENASRLASMQAAEKNVRNHLSLLAARYHQARQQSITEELLDIVAGFESLTQGAGVSRSVRGGEGGRSKRGKP